MSTAPGKVMSGPSRPQSKVSDFAVKLVGMPQSGPQPFEILRYQSKCLRFFGARASVSQLVPVPAKVHFRFISERLLLQLPQTTEHPPH